MSYFVEFTTRDFLFLDTILKGLGYEPLPVRYGEQGYQYKGKDNRIAFVWSSYVPYLKKFRDPGVDAGRAGIKKNEVINYMSKDFLRTKNFILRLLVYAEINKYRVDHPVVCPHCCRFLAIKREWETKKGEPTRRYYQICQNRDEHPDHNVYIEGWDSGVPLNFTSILEIRRKDYSRYKRRLKKQKV